RQGAGPPRAPRAPGAPVRGSRRRRRKPAAHRTFHDTKRAAAAGAGGDPMMTTDLEAALRDLRAGAPASVGHGALVAAGLSDLYAPIETPLGEAFVAWNGRGVSWVGMASEPGEFEARFAAAVGRPIQRGDALPARLAKAIRRRLDGDRQVRIPLDLRGHTPFEVMVWMKALEIPRGEVRPYGWIA